MSLLSVSSNPGVSASTTFLPLTVKTGENCMRSVQDSSLLLTRNSELLATLMNYGN